MESTLRALGQLIIEALPTFFLVLFLHFFLKKIFFQPLEKVLAQRRQMTEGARQSAAASLDQASRKAAEYEDSLRAARNEIYKHHEQIRREWREEHAAGMGAARASAESQMQQAREQIAAEAAEARMRLAAESQSLAEQITRQVLGGAR